MTTAAAGGTIKKENSMSETITIGGVDYTATDREARDIIAYLATEYGITEQKWAHMPWREQTNVILMAQREIKAIAADDIREFHSEDLNSMVSIDRRHVVGWHSKGSGRIGEGAMGVLTDKIEVETRSDPEFDVKSIETILCGAQEFKTWVNDARAA